ncbi:hydrogenase expression/formation protein HypE [Verrucomicrobiota bacterium]
MDDTILMGHGGGGLLTRSIIDEIILRELGNPILEALDDAACLEIPESKIAMTTDSFVVDPIFFPGGDIGSLAVCGTVNDLAMQGAEPRYLSLGLIIEEGLPVNHLEQIIKSVGNTAKESDVLIVTGDTKVVEKSRASEDRSSRRGGIFINTTGIGVRASEINVAVSNAQPGDAVIVTGSIGDHGIAIMNMREGLKLESDLMSDVAPLWGMIGPLLNEVPTLHCLRDPTRGGLAAALCDIADSSSVGIRLSEQLLPVKNEVRGTCNILGLDVLNVANEGKAIIVCADDDSALILEHLRANPLGREACVIGRVVTEPEGTVLLETVLGGERIVSVPAGEDLPRIC